MKTYEIGLSCSPSHHVEDSTINVTEFMITFGGGMGGANKKRYATSYKKDGIFYEITLNDGLKERYNENHIVSMIEKKLVKVVIDTTKHVNYNKHVTDETVLKTEYFLLNTNDEYKIVNRYTYRGDMKIKTINI